MAEVELTPEGKEVQATLLLIQSDPTILEKDPQLKDWYEKRVVPMLETEGGGNKENKLFNNGGGSVDMEDFIRSKFGVNSADELETEVSQLRAADTEAKRVEASINDMSIKAPELYNAMTAFLNGGDYKKSLTRAGSDVNFEKPLNDQSIPELLTHYFGDIYTKEEIKDYKNTDNEALKKSISIARQSFENDRSVYVQNKQNQLLRNQTAQQEFGNSLKGSVENLKKSFPNISKAQEEKLTTAFTQGAVNNFFFDRSGKVSQEAMKNLYMLMYPSEFKGTVKKETIEKDNTNLMEMLERGKGGIHSFNNRQQLNNGGDGDAKMAGGLLKQLGFGKQKEWGANTKQKK